MSLEKYKGKSYSVVLYVSGNKESIRNTISKFCLKGECVNISDIEYIYKQGIQLGTKIEFIEYPVYPRDKKQIWSNALELGKMILKETSQGSFTIMDDKKVETYGDRD